MKILRKYRLKLVTGVLQAMLFFLISGISATFAVDWPCFRGPNHNGSTTEGIERWPPQEIWRANVGQGYSQVVVSQGRVYTMGWTNNLDYVTCYSESSTGTNPPFLWQASYPYDGSSDGTPAYHGTRCTPTVDSVDSNEVYTYCVNGQLNCFNAITGSNIWSQNVNVGMPTWGFASSPLVESNNVIVNAGGACIAIDKHTSLTNWTSTNYAGYSSPFALTLGSQRTVVVASYNTVSGVNPANGNVLWYFNYSSYGGMVTPIIYNNQIFASQYYGYGGPGVVVMNLGSGQLTSIAWSNSTAISGMNTGVLTADGYMYSLLNPTGSPTGPSGLACVQFSTGSTPWCGTNTISTRCGLLSGITLANDEVVIMTGTDAGTGGPQYDESGATMGNGYLVVVSATPSVYTEWHRTNLISSSQATWTSPTLANGKLYLRAHDGTLICYDVSYSASWFSNCIPPADYLDHYFPGTNYATAAASVAGNGMTVWQDYVTGMNPTNNSNCLKASIFMSGTNIIVTYPTIAATDTVYAGRARYYGLQSVTNLLNSTWQPIPGATNILGTNTTVSYTNSVPAKSGYYQVNVMLR